MKAVASEAPPLQGRGLIPERTLSTSDEFTTQLLPGLTIPIREAFVEFEA